MSETDEERGDHTDQPIEEQQPQEEKRAEPPKAQASEEETPEQINWKKYREERKKERQAKEEAERIARQREQEAEALKKALEAALDKKPSRSDYDSDDDYEDDAKKFESIVEKKFAEYERKRQQQFEEEERKNFPQKLQQTYSDFGKVCNEENLDYLEYHYPEVAEPFKHMPDSYEKWSGIYKAVKRFVKNPDAERERKKAEQNMQRPKSMSTQASTQSGDSIPMILDDARKHANWERMQRRMKGLE